MNGINTNKGYLKSGIRRKFQSVKVAESPEGSLPHLILRVDDDFRNSAKYSQSFPMLN